jgi:hypothetical protein
MVDTKPRDRYLMSAQEASALRDLDTMSVGDLRERFRTLTGVPTQSRNRDWLRKRCAWRIQEIASGGLSPRALAQIELLAPRAPQRWLPAPPPGAVPLPPRGRDPRIPPPGGTLTRVYADRRHTVTVLDDGFEYDGKIYRSLSTVAKRITGTGWNGLLFFDLVKRGKERAS